MQNPDFSTPKIARACVKGVKFLTQKKYNELNEKFIKFLLNKVYEGHKVKLPERLGVLYIQGMKENWSKTKNGKYRLAIDWKETKNYEKNNPDKTPILIYYKNLHTEGVRYKFFWSKKDVILKNKEMFSLRMSKYNKKLASKYISEGREYFIKETITNEICNN